MPRERGWSSGKPPSPIREVHTGAWRVSAKRRSSGAAPEAITPPPAYRKGRLDCRSISAALASRLSSGRGEGDRGRGDCLSYWHRLAVMSLGTSMSTGPGLPDWAIWNALRMMSARSSTRLTAKLCLVTGMVIPVISTSWKLSRPSSSTATLPVMATMGMLSI